MDVTKLTVRIHLGDDYKDMYLPGEGYRTLIFLGPSVNVLLNSLPVREMEVDNRIGQLRLHIEATLTKRYGPFSNWYVKELKRKVYQEEMEKKATGQGGNVPGASTGIQFGMEFADCFRLLRESRFRSQTDCAAAIGISSDEIRLWEHGKGGPVFEELLVLQKFLGDKKREMFSAMLTAGIPLINVCYYAEAKIKSDLKSLKDESVRRTVTDIIFCMLRLTKIKAGPGVAEDGIQLYGRPLEHIYLYDTPQLPRGKEISYLIRVTGSSMEPEICNDDYLYIMDLTKRSFVRNPESLYLVTLNDDLYVARVGPEELVFTKCVKKIGNQDRLEIIGEVLGTCPPDNICCWSTTLEADSPDKGRRNHTLS